MIQQAFADRAASILSKKENIVGLCAGGSWISGEIDEYSDLDLIVVTRESISANKQLMVDCAASLGKLLSGFTGEHVGEPRLLICLYKDPLLHVDLKFLTLDELRFRIEDPAILLDPSGEIQETINRHPPKSSLPDFQWIEDRFWIWIHYAALKIGRGEYLEALDFLGYLRMTVLGPLLQHSVNQQPRGVRKVEMTLDGEHLDNLTSTIPAYNKGSILQALKNAISLYHRLRAKLYPAVIQLQNETEAQVIVYLEYLDKRGST